MIFFGCFSDIYDKNTNKGLIIVIIVELHSAVLIKKNIVGVVGVVIVVGVVGVVTIVAIVGVVAVLAVVRVVGVVVVVTVVCVVRTWCSCCR